MNIHEYQAKAVLREFGVPLARGIAIFSTEEALKAATELGGPVWVVKSQIHAGGRGKGRFKDKEAGDKGGVRVVKSVVEVVEATSVIWRRLSLLNQPNQLLWCRLRPDVKIIIMQ